MDISSVTGLFSSLSKISHFILDVWNTDGCLFSSKNGRLQPDIDDELKILSKQVMDSAQLKYDITRDNYAIFGVPLRDNGEIVGSLLAHGIDPDLDLSDRDATQAHANKVADFLNEAAAIMEEIWISRRETEEMAEDISMYFEDLALYARTATHFQTLNVSDKLFQKLAQEILTTMRSELAFVHFFDRPEYNVLVTNEKTAGRIDNPSLFTERLVTAIPPNTASLKENYFIVNDSSEVPGYEALHPDSYRFLVVAIKNKNLFYGWFGLLSFNMKEIFRRGELSLLVSTAQQLATTITNADLYNDLEQFVINVVKSFVYTIEAKDLYTRGHSERVNQYSMLIAEQMQLDDATSDNLNWASILHDIGKIGIPEGLLNKQGKLNDEEYGIVKGHPEKGFNILKPLQQLAGSLPGILHHHERFDGKGYPKKLSGNQIPLVARIIAVADTYDAINSSRAYRAARSPKEAMDIILKVSGTQLDEEIVAIFNKVYHEKQLWKEQ